MINNESKDIQCILKKIAKSGDNYVVVGNIANGMSTYSYSISSKTKK